MGGSRGAMIGGLFVMAAATVLIIGLVACSEEDEKAATDILLSQRVAGRVTCTGFSAIAGATVILYTDSGSFTNTTDATGRFDFGDVPPGDHFISVFANGYHPKSVEFKVEDDPVELGVTLSPIDP